MSCCKCGMAVPIAEICPYCHYEHSIQDRAEAGMRWYNSIQKEQNDSDAYLLFVIILFLCFLSLFFI